MIKAIRQCNNPYITHGGSTEISSHVESLRGISKSEISSFSPFDHIFGNQKPDFDYKLSYSAMQLIWFTFDQYILSFWPYILQVSDHIFYKFWPCFSVYGVGPVSECSDLRSIMIIIDHINLRNWSDHIPLVSLKSTRLRGLCTSSLVCLCHGSVYCASMCASMCQHARSMPACQMVIPEVSELPWMFPEVPWGSWRSQMSWRPGHCATVPDGSKPTSLYLWHEFYLKWWYLYCFTSHVMAYWLWVLSKKVLEST